LFMDDYSADFAFEVGERHFKSHARKKTKTSPSLLIDSSCKNVYRQLLWNCVDQRGTRPVPSKSLMYRRTYSPAVSLMEGRGC
jgi:hypothetical protein